MTLIYLTLGWVAGIILASRTEIDLRAALAAAVTAALLNVWFFYADKTIRLVCFMVVFFALGIFRFELAQPDTQHDHVIRLNDRRGQLSVRGVVVAEPRMLDTRLQVLVEVEEAAGQPANGRVLIYADRTSDIRYGDEIQAFGILRTPPTLDDFDYRNYLSRQKIFSLMPGADVQIVSSGTGVYATLFDLKEDARKLITSSLPEPHASLLVGILLGNDSGLSSDVEEAFIATGTSHVIAISGFNMVILAQTLMSVLRRFMKKEIHAAAIGVAAIAIYTVFVGAGAAVVRAAVMSALLIIGQALRRKTHVPSSLAFAALVMSALNPWTLWDVGFQLSFAAVAGMAVFVPPLEKRLANLLNRIASRDTVKKLLGVLSDPLIVTTAAQITTLPLILYYFGRLSLVSPLVNFIIIPFQPFILLFGALGVVVGLLIPPVGELILSGAWLFLTFTVEVIEYFAGISLAEHAFQIGQPPVILFFGGLTLWMLYQSTRPRWALKIVGNLNSQVPLRTLQFAALVALALLVSGLARRPDHRLHVIFLNVGAGNGVLIESPDGAVILVDGGNLPSRLLNQLGDQLPPRTRHLDVLVMTSPRGENIAALPEVIDRYEIGTVLTTGQDSDVPEYRAILTRLEEKNIPVVTVTAGYTLKTDDGLLLEVLYPSEIPAGNTSLVLRVTYGEAVFLLTGNITADEEAVLLQNPHLIQATVLQVANHGGGNSSSSAFIDAVQPQVAVIQTDIARQNISPTVVDRLSGSRLFRTDEQGLIEIITDGKTLIIKIED